MDMIEVNILTKGRMSIFGGKGQNNKKTMERII